MLLVGLSLTGCATGSDDDAAATTTDAGPPPSVSVLTLNLLHGLFCPEETDFCQAPDRVALFGEQVEAAGCPDLIGLQEVGPRLEALLLPAVAGLCEGSYEVAWEAADSPDRVMVLSRLPILDQGYLDLAADPWEAYWVRVDAAVGPVDLLTAHFASSANDPPCEADGCPPICEEGSSTNQCHAVEVVDQLDQLDAAPRDDAVLSIVAGDLNAEPDSSTVTTITDAGFVDAWLTSGQEECDPATHLGCTSGGDQPEPFVGMDTVEGPGFDTRVDQVLVRDGGCDGLRIDADAFASEPRETPVNGLSWPSDHAGVEVTLTCA